MQIDARKLKEVIPKWTRRKIKHERFYAVPNADGYSLSDYGRLVYGNKRVHLVRKVNYDLYTTYYRIKFNDKESESLVRLDKLVAMVFRPDEKIYCLVNFHWINRSMGLFNVEKLHVIRNKAELIDYIRSKIEGIKPSYQGAKEEHGFINRNEYTRPIALVIAKTFLSMKYRAGRWTNYEDVSVSKEWDTCDPFYEWYCEHNYYYPEPLELDKDLITFGVGKIYSPETCCLLPRRLNTFFSGNRGTLGVSITIRKQKRRKCTFKVKNTKTYPNYFDALRHAREEKAKQIRQIVKEEREKGFMPEYILDKMSQWANLAEMGLIKIWEPDLKTLIKKGII